MHEGEHGRHMCSVVTPSSLAAVVPSGSVASISSETFSKDGRKINIGDCALFKPPQDSPPFIGIIRRLVSGEEENLRLSVNWLYRPADIKLVKGASVEAAPNELFYSFHKDEILAASLLHPCKVSFLCKGVELPIGTSSYVCRRVYDVENKCLWWLTDQDYIDERQEEVNQLLQKTQLDMYGTTGNQQLRSSSESAQNINSHLPSQIKIKKRDRVDQGSDSVKRERISRADDTDYGQLRPEQVLKSEISKITERGGLVDYEGVEKLVQLMQPDKKIDLACKMMLVDVIVFTDKFDCLGWFVQLRGLPVLDKWLQEIHKGKIGDGSSPKESDKPVDDFLLILLRALDKLPVNLHALQTCNVGKSVNHLRTHKNIEIQKKARSLVDTWKRRVEAEMNVLDSKSGSSRGSSWPSKSMHPEVSRQSEANGKSSSAQSSGKIPYAKVVATSPNSTKSIASSTKDPISVAVAGSDPLSTIKEEKSSSSSHSQNNSQFSSSTAAGSINENKISVSSSRHRKSSHNFQGSALPGVQKESSFGKLCFNKNTCSEKVSPPDSRLIVRLPNTGRSPARSSTGSPHEDPTAMSKNPLSALSAKNDHRDSKLKGKNDALRLQTFSKGDVEDKNILIGSVEGNLSPPGASSNDKKQFSDDKEKAYKPRDGNLYDASFKSMNALVESCVKFSEASASASGGDNIGMNLLATVAAREMSRSDGSHSVSRGRNLPLPEESCSGNDVSSRHIDEDTARSEDLACNGVDLRVKDESSHDAIRTLAGMAADKKASIDASMGITSENAITEDNMKIGGAGELHGNRARDEDINANCTNEKIMENNALKLAEVAAGTKPVTKEAEEESPSFSCTEMCQGDKINVLRNVSGKANEESLVVKSEACALPSNSVSIISSVSEREKATATDAANQIKQTEKSNDNISSTVPDPRMDLVEKSNKNVIGYCPDKSSSEEPNTVPTHQADELISSNKNAAVEAERVVKLDFDLNEGFDVEDEEIIEPQGTMSSAQLPCALITVASAAKGPFYPPENSFRSKGELGWKGSAATSAFRPAEPRKILDSITSSPKQGRPHLDFDLNIADEREIEDEMVLDLNRVDQSHELPKVSLNNTLKMGFSNTELNSSRDFDLNSGPGPDDVATEIATRAKNNISFISPLPGVRMSSSDQASVSSWFPQASNPYPPIAITPIVPAPASQRIMGHPAGMSSFGPEFYRGPVLSSSPALPFPNNPTFQYPFPFDTNFPSYPNISTAYPPHYPRTYMMNIPGGVANAGADARRWVGQGLDLNTGPNVSDERSSSSLRHPNVSDEQLRMYQMGGGSLKRKDPDGGRDGDRSNYKQQLPPWQ